MAEAIKEKGQLSDLADLWRAGWANLRARWYLRHATYLGPRVRLWGRPAVNNQGRLVVEERAILVSTITPLELVVERGGELIIGERTFINYGCSIAANLSIDIGPDCHFGTYVMLMDNDFHRLEPEHRLEKPPSAPILIQEKVWLCSRVIVLRGVTIGAGSVVGAGSIVSKDIPPRTLAVGAPARPIRKL
jgi:maltose O-acetyltransferase